MTLVITNCTNRKRKPIETRLHMSAVRQGSMADVVADWKGRLAIDAPRYPVSELYGGRGYREVSAAAEDLGARLSIVSAGLGLVEAHTPVPPYACTVLKGAADSVRARVNEPFRAVAWWAALQGASPFAKCLRAMVPEQAEPILVALSDTYLNMLSAELIALPAEARNRLRIFTRAPEQRVADPLRPYLMPYDDRLDGPDSAIRGTRSDFAPRALRHFVSLGVSGSVRDDQRAVAEAIGEWRMPAKFDRARHDDAGMLSLMRDHWDAAGGSSTRLLRMLRDDLDVACEQSRFATLARQIREERA